MSRLPARTSDGKPTGPADDVYSEYAEYAASLYAPNFDDAPNPDVSAYPADSLATLLNEKQELNWLVEGWLEQGTLAVLVGQEGSFKSFVAIDWALHIATGQAWHGARVDPGRVLYVAGEGRTGVIRRMRGWCDQYGRADVDDVFLGRAPIHLLDPNDAERVGELGEFNLVVIDTLARCYGLGSENDAKDMSAAIRTADDMKTRTGATVLLLHHAPLEGREEGKLRPRGSSALSGAADAIFTSQYDKESKVITVSQSKAKDAKPADSLFLSFDVVDLGERDNFGNSITTLVLCPTHKRPASNRPLGKNQRLLVQTLRSMISDADDETFVTSVDVNEKLEAAKMNRYRRRDVLNWMREQSWCRPAAAGHLIDGRLLPRG